MECVRSVCHKLRYVCRDCICSTNSLLTILTGFQSPTNNLSVEAPTRCRTRKRCHPNQCQDNVRNSTRPYPAAPPSQNARAEIERPHLTFAPSIILARGALDPEAQQKCLFRPRVRECASKGDGRPNQCETTISLSRKKQDMSEASVPGFQKARRLAQPPPPRGKHEVGDKKRNAAQ